MHRELCRQSLVNIMAFQDKSIGFGDLIEFERSSAAKRLCLHHGLMKQFDFCPNLPACSGWTYLLQMYN